MRRESLLGGLLIVVGLFIFVGQFVDMPGNLFLFFLSAAFFFVWSYLGGGTSYSGVGFLIPACVLLAVALYSSLDRFVTDTVFEGSLFFLFLGGAFMLVYGLHTRKAGREGGERNWPLYPAGGLAAFGLFVLLVQSLENYDWLANIIFPVILIGAGAYLLYRSTRTKKTEGPKE